MIVFGLLALLSASQAQNAAPADPPFLAQLTETLHRAGTGHSPAEDEIMAVESESGLLSGPTASSLLPLLQRALQDPDAAVRGYGLAMLVGMQTLPAKGEGDAKAGEKLAERKPEAAPAPRFQAEVLRALLPLVPFITARLTDEHPQNRDLAVTDLAGFAPAAPAEALTALLAYLKRDDAVSAVGVGAAGDLLAFGPLSPGTVEALVQYGQRSDQTAEVRTSLVQKLAASPNQSQQLNQSTLPWLDSEDPHLRSTLILALPLLDLSPESYARMRDRVKALAAVDSQDTAEVVGAARAVDGCWTQVKVAKGCPAS